MRRAPAPAMVALCRDDCTAHTHGERRAGHAPEGTETASSQNRTSIPERTLRNRDVVARIHSYRAGVGTTSCVGCPVTPMAVLPPPPAAARHVRRKQHQKQEPDDEPRRLQPRMTARPERW